MLLRKCYNWKETGISTQQNFQYTDNHKIITPLLTYLLTYLVVYRLHINKSSVVINQPKSPLNQSIPLLDAFTKFVTNIPTRYTTRVRLDILKQIIPSWSYLVIHMRFNCCNYKCNQFKRQSNGRNYSNLAILRIYTAASDTNHCREYYGLIKLKVKFDPTKTCVS